MESERALAVFGTGAVGGYLGGKLAAVPDLTISLLGRAPFVDTVNRRGLVVREGSERNVSHPRAVTASETLLPQDVVLLCVRAYDVKSTLPELRALLGDRGLLVALQNGVGTEECLAGALGRERVLAGTLTVSAGTTELGVIDRYSGGGGMALSTMDGSAVPPWLVETFVTAGLPTITVDSYRSLRWSKLLLNMLGAPISAILDVGMPTIVTNPDLFRLEQLAVREAGQIMDTQGVKTVSLPGYPVPILRAIMRLPVMLAQIGLGPQLARARGGHSPTMRADMRRDRSEVGWLNGAVAAASERVGRHAPVNAALTELVRTLVALPERRDEFRGRPDALIEWLRGVAGAI